MASEFRNSLPTSLTVLKNEKAEFNVALSVFLNTHFVYEFL
jgi:hypothetical protein